jgi:hypothetical protein
VIKAISLSIRKKLKAIREKQYQNYLCEVWRDNHHLFEVPPVGISKEEIESRIAYDEYLQDLEIRNLKALEYG